MATINFKLRKDSKSTAVYLYFVYGRKKELRYSTGLELKDRTNWNEEKQQVKNVLAEPNAKTINTGLRKIEKFVDEKYNELHTSLIEINNKVLRNELDIFLRRKKTAPSITSYKTLLECYKWYYEHFSKNPVPSTKKPLAYGTIRSYKTSYKVLKEYNDEILALSYDKITLEFYYSFLDFLRQKNFSNNYISNHIKMLKTIMNYAWECKFHNNLDFKSKAFTKISEDVYSIYLTVEELKAINKLELQGRKDNARDIFLIGAYSGLRISDLKRLTKNNIKSDGNYKYIEITTKKTNSLVVIPINSIVQKILDKRNGIPPKRMPDQNINELLKDIAADARLNDTVQIKKTKGGKSILIEKAKHELISTHAARRSFCTNAYIAGMPIYDIMQISSHKTERSFLKYIKLTQLEGLRKAAKHPFFN